MKSGPIKQGTPKSYLGRNKNAKNEAAQGTDNKSASQEPLVLTPEQRVDVPKEPEAESKTEAPSEPVDTPPQQKADDGTPLAVKFGISDEVVDKALSGDLVMALVPKDEKAALESKGAYFPDNPDAVLGDGVGPEGSIELTPLYDTNNPATKNHVVTHEVDKKNLEVNPETGVEQLKAGFTPTILAQGEGILPSGFKPVNEKAVVIPEGYVGTLGHSKASQKVESTRSLANNLAKTVGSFSGSSLAGIMNLPVITNLAPILAIGSAGFVANKSLEAKRDAVKQLGYLDQQVKKSTNDLVEMQDVTGDTYLRSAKNERTRLEAAVRQANLELGSTALLAASGSASVVGGMAGMAGMAGAAAAAPYLAGGAMILGSGTMVFNSLAQLKSLAKEKAELEAAQAKGETHAEVAVELPRQIGTNPKTGKPIARLEALDKMVEVPIDDRIKQIEKEQRKQRLLATAVSGGMLSIGNMVTGASAAIGVGTMAAGFVALAPAGVLLGVQSAGQLKELGKEKAELLAAKERGETMVERDVQQADYTFAKEKIPISTLLAENKKARNKHKLILTSVGSAGAALGVGLTMGGLAAAPLALVPIAVGAMLFPDKVKVFADKVKGLVSGFVGESGSTKRAARKATGELVEQFSAKMDEKLAGLKEQTPGLFTERPSKMSRMFPNPLNALRKEYGGFYHEMNHLVKNYAESANPAERQEYLAHIGNAIRNAPEEAQPGLKAFQEEVLNLSLDVEAQWTARDIALKMKDSVGKQVLSDKRAAARIEDLGYKKEDIPEMYKETLQVMDFERQITQLATRKQLEEMEAERKAQIAAQQAGVSPDQVPREPINPIFEPAIEGLQGALVEYVDSVNGDSEYDANRWAYRTEVLKASHHLASTERDLGAKLTTRFIDAAQRPEDTENLDLLLKEVQYARQTPVTEQDLSMLSNSTRILETPVNLAPEQPDEHVAKLRGAINEMGAADPDLTKQLLDSDAKISNPEHFKGMTAQEALAERTKLNAVFFSAKRGLKSLTPDALKTWQDADTKIRQLAQAEQKPAQAPMNLSGPEARMANAFLGITKVEPKLGKELGDAFTALISPESYAGMDANQVAQAKVGHNLRLQKARRALESKEPELLALWDTARAEVDKAYFDREMNQDFKETVLDRSEVTDAAERLGIETSEVEGLYNGLMKSQLLHDPRELNARLMDESGKEADPSKLEMLSIIDKAMLKTAAEQTQGGADFDDPAEAPADPQQDPNVVAYLQQRPDIVEAINSDGFKELSARMQLPLPQVVNSYLTLVQADLNPAIAAEFNGRLEGGDMNAVNTFNVGREALGYITEFVKPDPELVKQGVEEGMQGVVVQTVLNDPNIKAQAESLGVDADQAMRLFLRADIGKDPTILAEVEMRAQKGDAAAAAQLQFLQNMIPAVQYVAQQVQAGAIQVPPGEPPQAA